MGCPQIFLFSCSTGAPPSFKPIFFTSMLHLFISFSFSECALLPHYIMILFTPVKLDIYLVLSESMVWKRFSSSSSFRVPSEKKAWNSSKESFPSSAKRQRKDKRKDFSHMPCICNIAHRDSQMFILGFRQMLNKVGYNTYYSVLINPHTFIEKKKYNLLWVNVLFISLNNYIIFLTFNSHEVN